MIYTEKEHQMGDKWYSFCVDNLGKRYQQWMVPIRVLEMTPAEYVRFLIEEFNATVVYKPESGFLSRCWDNQADEARWRLFINNKAKERGFHI